MYEKDEMGAVWGWNGFDTYVLRRQKEIHGGAKQDQSAGTTKR